MELATEKEQSYVVCPSGPMRVLENAVAEIAATSIPILLMGESGSGKEMLARRIHRMSANAAQPIKKIPCASVDGQYFASELGLKTKGQSQRWQHKEAPGTMVLDEIAELQTSCQRILLTALPDGDEAPRSSRITARLISTTNRNLEEDVRAGQFRSELYYRISGARLRLPPLRERKDDILPLVESFLTKYAAKLQRARPSLSERTAGRLLDYSWPGNIRELENVIQEIVALGDEDLVMSMMFDGAPAPRTGSSEKPLSSLKDAARAASREAEKDLILKALARTQWNRKRAARELQISYKSLLHKMKQIRFADSRTGER